MGTQGQFTTRVDVQNGVASVALVGELDLATAPILSERLVHLERDDVAAIMLDLREVTFLDCSGLHAFLQAHEHAEANGHRLILLEARPSVRRLLELTETAFLLDDQETVRVLDRFTGSQTRPVDRSAAPDVGADV